MIEPKRLVVGGSPTARSLLQAGRNDAPSPLLASAVVGSPGAAVTAPIAGRRTPRYGKLSRPR